MKRKEGVRHPEEGSIEPLAIAAMEQAWELEEDAEASREALFHAYLMAARAGRVEAMTNAGLHLMYGDGTRKDVREALGWMRKAARLGDDVAAFNLGLFYGKGQDVRQDRRLAERWYRRAMDLGFPPAKGNLATLLYFGRNKEKWKEAVVLCRALARNGDMAALCTVADAYERGRGVRKNLGKAIQLYKKAAAGGDAEAQSILGWMCINGVGGARDVLGAIRWYQEAAKQGHVSGFFSLGHIYAEGDGVPKSKARAVRYYRMAAAAGHPRAANCLKALGVEM
ncbi:MULTISPECIES: tetratricopeptide repeat protein [Corallococcus]|uniref:tetratricopeptide repeat protein n=1 Tax=Corallococcus TaxID=83461 RepID=UPI002103BDDB|nr:MULTISPECIES: tetratricopeptide repeat protein [Corallococcus]